MIILKSPEEVEKIAAAGRVVARVIERLRSKVAPGVTTADLDRWAEGSIFEQGARPAFKGYRNFPGTVCTSINNEVVHGIPSPRRRLEDGDIIGLDVGAIVDGFYGDAAVTLPVGSIAPEAQQLLKVTEEALYAGIAQARVGNRLSDISHAVQSRAEAHGYSVVTDFVGHGIGRNLHEDPPVPNFGRPGQGPRLRPGMVLAIEPMVNLGASDVRVLEDGWTAVTKDGSLSAHFEHTIAITEEGPRVLTRLDP